MAVFHIGKRDSDVLLSGIIAHFLAATARKQGGHKCRSLKRSQLSQVASVLLSPLCKAAYLRNIAIYDPDSIASSCSFKITNIWEHRR